MALRDSARRKVAQVVTDAAETVAVAAVKMKARMDAWGSVLMGLGQRAKDARKTYISQWHRFSEQELDDLYAGDAIAAKVVDLPVEEGLNKGYTIIGISADAQKKLKERLDELYFDYTLREALTDARQKGGACILKVYDDSLRLEKPVEPGNTDKKRILALVKLQRFELPAYWEDVQRDLLSTEFRKPIWYTYTAHGNAGTEYTNQKIHHSRLVRFDGVHLPDRICESNNYWGDSVYGKTYEAIRNFALAHDGVSMALKDMSVAVFKIKGLAEQVASDCDEKVIKRLEIVNLSKAIAKAVVLDAEAEDFDYKTRTFAGAADMIDRVEGRLAAETNIPRTVLLGESPKGGLGQSGDHESDNWYDWLEAYQKNRIKPGALEIIKEVAEELGIPTDKLDIKFNPLWQMSAKEEAETRKTVAETDKSMIEAGVLDPSEVRESRYGGDEYSAETELDPTIDPEDLKVDPLMGEEGDPENPEADPEAKGGKEPKQKPKKEDK